MKKSYSQSKLCLVLFFSIFVGFCFISCKKECICSIGGILWIDDDGAVANGYPASEGISVGKLNNTDCKNFEGFTKTERDEQIGRTYYTTYGKCQLQ